MNDQKKLKVPIRMLVTVLYLILSYILQSMVLTRLTLFGVKPFILPLVVAGMSLFGGHAFGCAAGLMAGILCDISFNQPTIEFTLVFTLMGLLLGIMSDTILVQGFPSYLLCSALALMISALCQVAPMLMLYDDAIKPLVMTAAYQTLYSLLYSVPFYYLSKFAARLDR